jgi:hypothetical protein
MILLILLMIRLRDDIIVYLLAHPETTFDEDGFPQERSSYSRSTA